MNLRSCSTQIASVAFTLSLLTSGVHAGQMVADGKSKVVADTCKTASLWTVDTDFSYVFESDFERGHDAKGNAVSEEIKAGYRIPFTLDWPKYDCGQWYLRLGFDYARWDFDNEGGLPIPNHLQSAAGVIAFEYLVNGRTAFVLETEPGIYFQNDINTGTFNAPTKLAGTMKITDHFFVIAGVHYDALRSYPFLPILGVYWDITDRLRLEAYPPEPRLVYQCTDKLSVWVGGEVAGGSFKTDNRDVPHKHKLSGAVVDYSEYRAGGGLAYTCHGAVLEIGGGWVFQRKFDYHRAEEGYRTDEGAPYVKVSLGGAF